MTVLRNQWFWIALGTGGYLLSLQGILWGIGFPASGLACLIVLTPLFLTKFSLTDRLHYVTAIAAIIYMFLIIVLIQNSYFPSTLTMVIELFFVLLITIPAFLIRAPMYLMFGVGKTDDILLISGTLFLILFIYGIKYAPKMHKHNLHLMLCIVLLSIFITVNECILLGKGIKQLSAISGIEQSIRNYYRIAVNVE